MKKLIVVLSLLGVGAVVAPAQSGYFAQTLSKNATTVLSGPAGNPGAAYVIATVSNVPAGTYLITARVDGEAYGPNSGAVCFLSTPGDPYGVANMTQNMNTSSDWTKLATATTVLLGKGSGAGTYSLVCQRGYSFTGGSLFWGTLMLVKAD
ncbi:MAG TPA: hypothetical protein VGM43_00760 [Bryobacteraceae bacterium]|jgi:hypothetical protein